MRVSDATVETLITAGTITDLQSARTFLMSSGAHTNLGNGEDVDV